MVIATHYSVALESIPHTFYVNTGTTSGSNCHKHDRGDKVLLQRYIFVTNKKIIITKKYKVAISGL